MAAGLQRKEGTVNYHEIIAWTEDGEFYCPDCFVEDKDNPEQTPIFAGECEHFIGYSCGGACGTFLAPNLDWELIADCHDWPWARCTTCNTQKPFDNDSRTRLAALRGKLVCENCLKPTMHFHA